MPARLIVVAPLRSTPLLLAAACLIGCNRPSAPPVGPSVGAVAVIDLDRVAQHLGQDKRITQSLNVRQESLNRQLGELTRSYQQQLSQQKAAEEASVPGQGVALASWQQKANSNLSKARQQIESDLATHRAQLVVQFREQIKPFARDAARARGLTVIVTKNDSVVYDFTEAVDITDDVVSAIRSQREAQPLPQATSPRVATQGDETLNR